MAVGIVALASVPQVGQATTLLFSSEAGPQGPVPLLPPELSVAGPAEPSPDPRPAAAVYGQRRTSVTDTKTVSPPPALLVRVPTDLPILSSPGRGRRLGTMPARSKYLRTPTVAWVMRASANGRYGRVSLPYQGTRAAGWIDLDGLGRMSTRFSVWVDLSEHVLVLKKRGRAIARFRAGTGSPSSPTPPGRYFVTDRVPFAGGSYYGSFAFGISGIQTRLPAGWQGGNQLAIHGTNDPSSIGRSVSAGCVRVSEAALARLVPVLKLGTPVTVVP